MSETSALAHADAETHFNELQLLQPPSGHVWLGAGPMSPPLAANGQPATKASKDMTMVDVYER